MVIAIKPHIIPSHCPRCSAQVPGMVFSDEEGYFVHCLSCGFVLIDKGRRPSPFKNLFLEFAKVSPETKHETTPKIKPVDNPQPSPGANIKPIVNHLLMLRRRCCSKHTGRPIPKCVDCEKTLASIADFETAMDEGIRRLRKK